MSNTRFNFTVASVPFTVKALEQNELEHLGCSEETVLLTWRRPEHGGLLTSMVAASSVAASLSTVALLLGFEDAEKEQLLSEVNRSFPQNPVPFKVRDFTPADWMTFGGCESWPGNEQPLIIDLEFPGRFVFEGEEVLGMTLLADATGSQILVHHEDDDGEPSVWNFPQDHSRTQARATLTETALAILRREGLPSCWEKIL